VVTYIQDGWYEATQKRLVPKIIIILSALRLFALFSITTNVFAPSTKSYSLPHTHPQNSMTCNIENRCDPYPEFCRRLAMPVVGKLGWFVHVVELVPLIWFSLMVIGVVDQDYMIVVGLLAASIIVALLAWIWNYLYNAPCFSNINLPSCDSPCGCELIIKGEPCDLAIRVKAGLRHTGDQEHFQSSLLGGIFVFILFGGFVIHFGTAAFNYVDQGFATQTNGHAQVMFYSISKLLQGMILLVYINSFRLLTSTTSDSILRYVTAVDRAPPKETSSAEKETLRYGNKKEESTPTKTRKGAVEW
jgi:hypothetical protein